MPQLPPEFAHLRSELGALVYGSMGIARNDADARRIAVLRNWEFFGAPLAIDSMTGARWHQPLAKSSVPPGEAVPGVSRPTTGKYGLHPCRPLISTCSPIIKALSAFRVNQDATASSH